MDAVAASLPCQIPLRQRLSCERRASGTNDEILMSANQRWPCFNTWVTPSKRARHIVDGRKMKEKDASPYLRVLRRGRARLQSPCFGHVAQRVPTPGNSTGTGQQQHGKGAAMSRTRPCNEIHGGLIVFRVCKDSKLDSAHYRATLPSNGPQAGVQPPFGVPCRLAIRSVLVWMCLRQFDPWKDKRKDHGQG